MADVMIERLEKLSTAELADSCLRLGVPIRCAPSDMQPIDKMMHCAGRVMPARHNGSVDVFLEALELAEPGDVLVVDDGGRKDQSVIGDMVAREVKFAGLKGIILWGCHRDTRELLEVGIPFFSIGKMPNSPVSVDRSTHDALEWARIGDWVVTEDDVVVGDIDGVIFLPFNRLHEIVPVAEAIHKTERRQAAIMNQGTSLREQFYFKDYLAKRAEDPSYDLRTHLNRIGGAIE